MNNPSSIIRTNHTCIFLQQIDNILKRWQKLDLINTFNSAHFESIMVDIDRARRQFDSKLFFIVVFGPLKAGKSTLTNALAGEYVSPAGFGKETTRRPSLVIYSKQSGIDQYFSTDPDINQSLSQHRIKKDNGKIDLNEDENKMNDKVRESFDQVADYIRGIRTKDELQNRVRINSLPLNNYNLEQTLTEDLPNEPLFTVIRCRGGNLLNHGVAIVDMPGLDGSRTNWREDPIHEWVIKRAEFFLFVQSSVAAWNSETRDFVQHVIAQSTRPPIWLIQNIFDACHWQPEEKRKKAEENQREEGKRRVTELMDEAPRSVLGINIGLAWDGRHENNEEWLKRSDFSNFESGLAQVLHSERALIQERNHMENFRQQISRANNKLSRIAQNNKQVRNKNNETREKLHEALKLFDAVDYLSDWESAIKGEISTIVEDAKKPWLDNLSTDTEKLKNMFNRKTSGKEINSEIKNIAYRLAMNGANKYFVKTLRLPQYVKLANKYCLPAEQNAINSCSKLLEELKLQGLPTAISPTADDLPSILQEPFTQSELDERFWYWLWKKVYDGGETRGWIDEYVSNAWIKQMEERIDLWKDQLLTDHFATYCEKRRKHYYTHMQRLISDFEAATRPKENAIDKANIVFKEMKDSLINIETPLANAIESIN